MTKFEEFFKTYMGVICKKNPDPSHDILHVMRVVNMAKNLCSNEKANNDIVVPAAYLHDCVYIAKTDSRRSKASKLSADKAVDLLNEWGYPSNLIPAIHHAISSHSFSANIFPETIEAKIVQDADRLDAMGAIGAMRCFAFSGLSLRPLYSVEDPFCTVRKPDDSNNTLDHFYSKLLKLQDGLNTDSAKKEGLRRNKSMKLFLESLSSELM